MQNRNVHKCTLQNGALWDMGLVHCGICATGLLIQVRYVCDFFSHSDNSEGQFADQRTFFNTVEIWWEISPLLVLTFTPNDLGFTLNLWGCQLGYNGDGHAKAAAYSEKNTTPTFTPKCYLVYRLLVTPCCQAASYVGLKMARINK